MEHKLANNSRSLPVTLRRATVSFEALAGTTLTKTVDRGALVSSRRPTPLSARGIGTGEGKGIAATLADWWENPNKASWACSATSSKEEHLPREECEGYSAAEGFTSEVRASPVTDQLRGQGGGS